MKLWKFLVLVGVVVGVVAVLVAGINFLVLPSLVHSNKVVAVPDLRGASPEAATDLLRPLDLEVVVIRRRAHPTMGAGLIVEQVPAPQAGIRSGRGVKVILSSGPATSAVPELVGLSERQAMITLERDMFQLGRVVRLQRAGITEPAVEGQEPQPGTLLFRGAIVSLVVAEPAARQLLMMPDLRGLQLFQARQIIDEAGLVVGRVSNERHGGGGANAILEQKPAAGRRVARGEEVELVASSR
jgi:beta-lactam-binding protein with PASTA domain